MAIKVLNMDAPDETEVRDAIQEVQLLSQLKQGEQHNIIRYHESFLEGSRLWVVMDYCSGGSVRTLVCFDLSLTSKVMHLTSFML